MSKSHSCGLVPTSKKSLNLRALKNIIDSISALPSQNSGRRPPTPPPLPTFLQENSVHKPELSWNEMKALKVKNFPVVIAKPIEFIPTAKQILKYAPVSNPNADAFIALQDKLNKELEEVLK